MGKNIYKRSEHISRREFFSWFSIGSWHQINISFVRRSSLLNVQSLNKKNQNQNQTKLSLGEKKKEGKF